MGWNAYNRRKDALRDMLALADRHEDTTLEYLLETVPGAREAFDDPAIVLFDAQMLFVQRVRGQVDMMLGDGLAAGSLQPEDVVVDAWAGTAQRMPGARRLLDAAETRGELTKAFTKERAMLATMAGVPALHPDLDSHGARLREAARERAAELRALETEVESRGGLIGRLRDAFAA